MDLTMHLIGLVVFAASLSALSMYLILTEEEAN